MWGHRRVEYLCRVFLLESNGSSTVFINFSCFDFKNILCFSYDMVQVINFCLFSCDVLIIYLDECSAQVLDRINGCVFSDFFNEWCDMFIDELCNEFVDYWCGWSRSMRKVLATMEDAAMMEDCL